MRVLFSRLSLLVTTLCVVLLCVLYLFSQIDQMVLLRSPESVVLEVKPGMTAKSVYTALSVYPLHISYWQWFCIAHLSGLDRHLQSGRYAIYSGERLGTVLMRFQQGRAELLSFRISPGDTFDQVRQRLNALDSIRHDTSALSDEEVAAHLGLVGQKTVEGFLMPETYFYSVGTSDFVLLRYAAHAMHDFIQRAWIDRDMSIPLRTPRDALVMASLIEKEAALPRERSNVASVFYNRMRLGMRLQTDPSVAYTMRHQGRIRKSDLDNPDDPYNTYRRSGLPPSAICFPSKSAMLAALHPVHSSFLYFVAKGDGTTVFSKNLRQHIMAVNLYQRKGCAHAKKRRRLHHARRH